MNKLASGNKRFINAICVAMICAFGMGLLAADVLAIGGCGLKCCCQSKPMTQHHNPQEQIRSSMGCCTGSTQMPCDLMQASELKYPDVTIATATVHGTTTILLASSLFNAVIDRYDLRGRAFDYFEQDKFRKPPLYLQNLSFLI